MLCCGRVWLNVCCVHFPVRAERVPVFGERCSGAALPEPLTRVLSTFSFAASLSASALSASALWGHLSVGFQVRALRCEKLVRALVVVQVQFRMD